MWHVFQMSQSIPEAKQAVKEISEFIKDTLELGVTTKE
jgi:hypothetical protein